MAFYTDGRITITDSANRPINGGLARFYNTGTTNLTNLFTTAALNPASPLPNPVQADSAGITPQIFAPAGTICDVQYMTAAGVPIPGRYYVGIEFVGGDTGTFSRTLADGTRVAFAGSGGVVHLRAGNASPNDIGGDLVIQGQDGTQLDSLTLDADTTDTTGDLKERGKKLPGVVETDATTFSGSGGIVIQLPNTPTGVTAWEVNIWNLIAAGVTPLTAQLSYDGGGAYKAGGSDYNYTKARVSYNAGSPLWDIAQAAGGADTKMDLTYHLRTAANRGAVLRLVIRTPNSGGGRTTVDVRGQCLDTSGATYVSQLWSVCEGVGGYGRASHLKLLQGANLISGSYSVIPLRGSGE